MYLTVQFDSTALPNSKLKEFTVSLILDVSYVFVAQTECLLIHTILHTDIIIYNVEHILCAAA